MAAAVVVLFAASAIRSAIAATDATLSLEGAQAAPGATVRLAVDLENQVGVRGVQFTLSSDSPVTLAECATSAQCSAVHAASRSSGFTADAAQQADGTIRVVLFSLSGTPIAQGNGVVLTLDIMVPPTASGGAITLTATDVRVAGVAGPLPTATIQLILESPPPPPAGGGGGGCALSEGPARLEAHWWVIFALTLALMRNRLRALARTR